MHEKEVGGVGLLTDLLGNTRCHRNRGNASGTDQRVDLSAGEEVHQLAKQNAACSTYAERDKTERDDEQCVDLEEVLGNCGSADSNAEEDRDNVHKFVCSCLYETVANAGFLHQVTEHKHTNKGSRVRNDERNDNCNRDREYYLLELGNLTEQVELREK